MRIMVDTNVLISALLFPRSQVAMVLADIISRHALVLSSFVVDELKAVVARKFPTKSAAIDVLLDTMRYEYIPTPRHMDEKLFSIRDEKDYPVLYTAIVSDVDLLVTGDNDFANVNVDHPTIMTPAQYAEHHI